MVVVAWLPPLKDYSLHFSRGNSDLVALQFWADFEELSDAARRELIRPILYRLRAFYRSPALRNMVCQSRGVDFTAIRQLRQIALVGLAGPAIQAEADFLGEMIISYLHLAALAGLQDPHAPLRPLYVAVDESQRFRGASLPILLSEGPKAGITLILIRNSSKAGARH
jgi:hypothetical protein